MIRTKLTDMFGLQHPLILAPMGGVAGGALAAAVSNAGGLGLVGGGYGDREWLRTELSVVKAGTKRPWGVGLITWSIEPDVLDLALSYRPDAFILSFGDPRPHVPAIRKAGCSLICQVQDLAQAKLAAAAGADLIVAEGNEAGGHSGTRGTLPFVPAAVDAVAPVGPRHRHPGAGGQVGRTQRGDGGAGGRGRGQVAGGVDDGRAGRQHPATHHGSGGQRGEPAGDGRVAQEPSPGRTSRGRAGRGVAAAVRPTRGPGGRPISTVAGDGAVGCAVRRAHRGKFSVSTAGQGVLRCAGTRGRSVWEPSRQITERSRHLAQVRRGTAKQRPRNPQVRT